MKKHQIIKLIRILCETYTGKTIGLAEAIETLDTLTKDGKIINHNGIYEINI